MYITEGGEVQLDLPHMDTVPAEAGMIEGEELALVVTTNAQGVFCAEVVVGSESLYELYSDSDFPLPVEMHHRYDTRGLLLHLERTNVVGCGNTLHLHQ